MVDDVLNDVEDGMKKAIEAFKRELGRVRTGRANLSLLDNVRVEYYGTPTPLNQVATLNIADARLITVKPWEKNLLAVIEKAIRVGGLAPSKSKRIRRILKFLAATRGEYSLESMRDMSDGDAFEYMTSMDGVGVKTAAVVLLFACGRDI